MDDHAHVDKKVDTDPNDQESRHNTKQITPNHAWTAKVLNNAKLTGKAQSNLSHK